MRMSNFDLAYGIVCGSSNGIVTQDGTLTIAKRKTRPAIVVTDRKGFKYEISKQTPLTDGDSKVIEHLMVKESVDWDYEMTNGVSCKNVRKIVHDHVMNHEPNSKDNVSGMYVWKTDLDTYKSNVMVKHPYGDLYIVSGRVGLGVVNYVVLTDEWAVTCPCGHFDDTFNWLKEFVDKCG